MLLIDHCRLTWPDFKANYSLRVETGALCAVVGPSGGGKTTLLHMIAGFEKPESGTLSLDSHDLLPLAPSERPVALVFQDHNLFPHLRADENVALGLKPSLKLSADEWLAVAEALDAVGLKGFKKRRPGEMSGGQRQRVALARALVSGRPLILLDEPFSNLDPGLRRDMIELVDSLRRKRHVTVVMTIHTPEEIVDVADQMAFVANGEVIASGTPKEVLHNHPDPRIAAFSG
ncbi:ATP-binding cassette domain-containing protein [Microvirga flavescens]|uniref:thiamine ABC transporter ATP-binding protein n=1 Tax=Microvirga flavescens TaxID=2249811 RepID=UPI000DD955B7|nr:ATP-binding cassette domain-containing protein [Microvirga flavescens]